MSDTSPEQPATPNAPKLSLKLPGQNTPGAADSAPAPTPAPAPAPASIPPSPFAKLASAPAPSPFAPKPGAPAVGGGAPAAAAPSPFSPKPSAPPTLGGIPLAGSRPPPPTASLPLTPGQISQAAKLPSGSASFASPMPELEAEENKPTPIWQAILAFVGAAGAITCAVLLYLIYKQPI